MKTNLSIKQVIDTVTASSTDAEIILAGQQLVSTLKSRLHVGCFAQLHALYDAELALCANSLLALQDEEGNGGMFDDFNEVVERLLEWMESKGASF